MRAAACCCWRVLCTACCCMACHECRHSTHQLVRQFAERTAQASLCLLLVLRHCVYMLTNLKQTANEGSADGTDTPVCVVCDRRGGICFPKKRLSLTSVIQPGNERGSQYNIGQKDGVTGYQEMLSCIGSRTRTLWVKMSRLICVCRIDSMHSSRCMPIGL